MKLSIKILSILLVFCLIEQLSFYALEAYYFNTKEVGFLDFIAWILVFIYCGIITIKETWKQLQ